MTRSPPADGATTVMFAETVRAAAGTPHDPVRTNVRAAPAPSAGPPRGPAALRVSTRRQGVTVKNVVPAIPTVGVGVGVGVRVGVGVGVGVGVVAGGRVGVGVSVGVGVAVGVAVGVRVGAGVGVLVGAAVGAGVRVGVEVAVAVGVDVRVTVGVRVGVGVEVGREVGVSVGVAVGVRVGVGVGVGVGATPVPYVCPATRVYPWVPFFAVTSTSPSACAPVVAVIVVAFTTVTPVAATPPIVTVAPPAKPVPVIVTPVPPAAGPVFGEMAVTTGPATVPKQLVRPSTYVRMRVVTAWLVSPVTPRNILMYE